ncbi:hypothetical protein GCM10025876_12470 [Demequina litorisediminis]|uniref:Ribosomal RNA small subunit methyltransferase A n=1 Tax=Demequina litorisediminis TaxID=1849022 RepID=A0ABQ6IE62_9MICO|nr:hypothetical protein GCM10025876_12470 [Demequina litorisediminis]
MADLLGPSEIRSLAESLGAAPTKKWGQNFVVDSGTVRRIVRIAGVQPGDHVVEVGPGLGSLTLALLEAGARVTAVEIDPKARGRAGGHGGAQGARGRRPSHGRPSRRPGHHRA